MSRVRVWREWNWDCINRPYVYADWIWNAADAPIGLCMALSWGNGNSDPVWSISVEVDPAPAWLTRWAR